jgi:hypothetical protein
MKKIFLLASVVLAGALTSCFGTPNIAISTISFKSDWVINQGTSGQRYVVCNNKQTQIQYSFTLDRIQNLDSWDATFFGDAGINTYTTTGLRINPPTANQGISYVPGSNTITVDTNFAVNSSPRVSNRAVVVVPTPVPNPQIISHVNLRLTLRDIQGFSVSGEISPFYVDSIPVVDNCP